MLEDRSARSAWKVALSGSIESPCPGDHGTGLRAAREGPRVFSSKIRPWPPSERALCRLKTRPARRTPRIVSCGRPELDGVVGIVRKVASWNRLVELYKSLWIDEFRSTELAPFALARRCGTKTVPPKKRLAATSKDTLDPRRTTHLSDVQRPTQLARGARGRRKDTRRTAAAAGARGRQTEGEGRRPGDRVVRPRC
ncbi:hypothetical protein THAOC_01246 [Thalassiosira oceanica]|uniref:Uncharacterized protein n=1 Tax=Thalassiosira oceanica TaxID=159749 RepID=K0THL4_THAOC|nr:hypothetical protein THAOC_01246 [Thalassiosira oceanica]|eukprot:EJK76960.1 hypothetical protein THAOC_01246 [Thalassiosira oceanica]